MRCSFPEISIHVNANHYPLQTAIEQRSGPFQSRHTAKSSPKLSSIRSVHSSVAYCRIHISGRIELRRGPDQTYLRHIANTSREMPAPLEESSRSPLAQYEHPGRKTCNGRIPDVGDIFFVSFTKASGPFSVCLSAFFLLWLFRPHPT